MKTMEKNKLILEYAKLATLPKEQQDQNTQTRLQTIADTLKMTNDAIIQAATKIAIATF